MSETMIKSADVLEMHVTGVDGTKLGVVRELFVDVGEGRIDFLIVEAAGLLVGSGKFHPVPWTAVQFDGVARVFQIEMTRDAFKQSPSYDRDQLASRSYGWDDQAARYFTTPLS